MQSKDIEEIIQIERSTFINPWPEDAFKEELKKAFSHFFVIRNEEKLIAYGGFWEVAQEAHIVNLAVHKAFRNKGIGKLLLTKLLEEARKLQLKVATLEVRQSNIVARNFYKKFNFIEIGRRKNYYSNEDAIIMKKIL